VLSLGQKGGCVVQIVVGACEWERFLIGTLISGFGYAMRGDALANRLPWSVSVSVVTYSEEVAPVWRNWLSAEEEACIASFGAEKRRGEFVAGRAAARQLLATHLDVAPAQVPLRRAEDDAVDVEVPDWHVSIAHSGPHALAACARHHLGADLEHIEPRDPAITRFLFAPEDRGLVEALPYDADAALILCWVLKEATLKARRSGFRTSPKDLHLTVDPEAETARVEVAEGGRWTLVYARLDGYWGAVAVPAD
jgi:4'-phosphopantetheinyl transferase